MTTTGGGDSDRPANSWATSAHTNAAVKKTIALRSEVPALTDSKPMPASSQATGHKAIVRALTPP